MPSCRDGPRVPSGLIRNHRAGCRLAALDARDRGCRSRRVREECRKTGKVLHLASYFVNVPARPRSGSALDRRLANRMPRRRVSESCAVETWLVSPRRRWHALEPSSSCCREDRHPRPQPSPSNVASTPPSAPSIALARHREAGRRRHYNRPKPPSCGGREVRDFGRTSGGCPVSPYSRATSAHCTPIDRGNG